MNLFLYPLNPIGWIDPLGLNGSWPTPPSNIPGGPWESAPGQRSGDYHGTKQPAQKGPRPFVRYVPAEGTGPKGGMSGAKEGYFKLKNPNGPGWQRYDLRGNPITPEQAHPSQSRPAPGCPSCVSLLRSSPWLLLFVPSNISRCQDLSYSKANPEECGRGLQN